MKRIKGINSLSDAVLRSASGGSRSAGGDDKSTKRKAGSSHSAQLTSFSSDLYCTFFGRRRRRI